jgi:hypothetical protein
MPGKSKVIRFNEVLQEIAAEIMAAIKAELKKKKWKVGFLDVRFCDDFGRYISKTRVELRNGELQSLDEPEPVSEMIHEAWELRAEPIPGKWYGLKVLLFPNGECKTEFNDDPDCSDDETFFQN